MFEEMDEIPVVFHWLEVEEDERSTCLKLVDGLPRENDLELVSRVIV